MMWCNESKELAFYHRINKALIDMRFRPGIATTLVIDTHRPRPITAKRGVVHKTGSTSVSYTHLTLPTNREV